MCSFDYDDETGYREYIECSECKEAEAKLYNIEKSIEQVVKLLYSNERLDVAVLDDVLGQICDTLGLQVPATLPRIRRSGSEIFEFAASMNQ